MAKSSRSRQSAEADADESASSQRSGATTVAEPGRSRGPPGGALTGREAERRYGVEISSGKQIRELQRMEKRYGEDVLEWTQEGMPIEAMGRPAKMEAFRQRKGTPVPWDVERRNEQSVQRSTEAASDTSPAGDAGVPDTVREVISSQGRSLDPSIQRAMEDRMGDSFGDVRVHTGPKAAQACDSIDARAFTVGNHVAFNHGEYDPSSAEGQHVLAHELAHVRQQTQGAVSMLPQEDAELEIDPDPALEREAEEAAQRAMAGGPVTVNRMGAEVHVQRAERPNYGEFGGGLAEEDALENVALPESVQKALDFAHGAANHAGKRIPVIGEMVAGYENAMSPDLSEQLAAMDVPASWKAEIYEDFELSGDFRKQLRSEARAEARQAAQGAETGQIEGRDL